MDAPQKIGPIGQRFAVLLKKLEINKKGDACLAVLNSASCKSKLPSSFCSYMEHEEAIAVDRAMLLRPLREQAVVVFPLLHEGCHALNKGNLGAWQVL